MNDDKPFVCPITDCGMRFTNEDHLNVHSKKHEMSLALNAEGPSSSPSHHFLDQTPTPTKFLKNIEEIGLFQELSKNPFDDAYKKALDPDSSQGIPLPGPQSGELNTPTLILQDSQLRPTNTNKTTEPLKPSPLVKNSNAGTAVLDLSGKSVGGDVSALASEEVKKNLAARLAANSSSTLEKASNGSHTKAGNISTFVKQTEQSGILTAANRGIHQISQHSIPTLTASNAVTLQSPGDALSTQNLHLVSGAEVKQEPMEIADLTDQQGEQQCTMHVLLQLPSGETVPISIPATINKMQSLESKQVDIKPTSPNLTSHTPIQPSSSKVQPTANMMSTMNVKQRLKAQLQNQLSPTSRSASMDNLANPNLGVGPGTAVSVGTLIHSQASGIGSVTSVASYIPTAVTPTSGPVLLTNTSPIMMVDSPGSEMNFSDSSDYSMDSKRMKKSPENGDSEERRRKFLERNRAAAARCRQKRKHWISNLEKKADDLTNTNAKLQSEVKLLRGEVAQLKTLLLAHKDCPVTQQQKSQGQLQHILLSDPNMASSQDLAQVVPTVDPTVESLQIGGTIVTFVPQDTLVDGVSDLQASLSKQD